MAWWMIQFEWEQDKRREDRKKEKVCEGKRREREMDVRWMDGVMIQFQRREDLERESVWKEKRRETERWNRNFFNNLLCCTYSTKCRLRYNIYAASLLYITGAQFEFSQWLRAYVSPTCWLAEAGMTSPVSSYTWDVNCGLSHSRASFQVDHS